MLERIRKIAAAAAIALGCTHLVYGLVVFKSLTLEHIWFAGAGIAMLCVGLANWHQAASMQAAIMCLYLGAMTILLPAPQVILGLLLFLTLLMSGRKTYT